MSQDKKARGSAAAGMSDRRVAQLLFGAVGVGFAALVVVALMTLWLLRQQGEFKALIDHTNQVQGQVAEFRVAFERGEAAQRGYLLGGERRFVDIYGRSRDSVERVLGEVGRLTVDNPVQQARVYELRKLIGRKLALIDRSLELYNRGDRAGALRNFRLPEQQTLLDEIRRLATALADEEGRLMSVRSNEQSDNAQLLLRVVIVAGVLLMLLASGSIYIMRRYSDALNASQAQLRRLNLGLEEAVKDRTADLTRANQEIQRFAYIVSHDLRSPLVNVMGFTAELEVAAEPLKKMLEEAEAKSPGLVSDEARQAIEVDLPESIGFIRSSTRKMDRLINAILKLSREGRRTVTPEKLDMNTVVENLISTVQHQAAQTGATVEIEGRLPDIVSDRLSIEQIFGNLIDNALKYQKPGRPGRVVIRGEDQGGRVHFEVEDNGRGIDPKDHERVFDLFRRAGMQDKPGEGIGLAHVRALVYRLGGLIDCRSALDQGATFRISLPHILAREEVSV
jgi:signal transduction histidine kinase